MYKRIYHFVLIAGMVTFSLGTAMADEYHYTNLLIGDRASGMGGAYTAVSDDATGLYYNPAGTAYTVGRSLSASVNAYYNTEKTYKSVIGGNGWVRTSSSLLPNYFGVVQPVGKFKVGISYAVPESMMEDQDQTFHDVPLSSYAEPYNPPGTRVASYIINYNNESNTYNFGPSIAMELNNKLSAGVTLYYYQHKQQWILNQIVKTTPSTDPTGTTTIGTEWSNTYYQTEEWGVRPILGFMWTPVNNVSIGLAMSKVLVQGSDTKYQTSYRREHFPVFDDSNKDGIRDAVISDKSSIPDGILDFSTKRKYPAQISLGVAWFASQSMLLSGDFNHYAAVNDRGVKAVNNLALGAEYYLSKSWAMRGGFYTDYANTSQVSSNGINQQDHIDLYGGTLSISRFTRNTAVTLGGGYTYGEGKAQVVGQLPGDIPKIQDATSQGWMFFLSSSYSY